MLTGHPSCRWRAAVVLATVLAAGGAAEYHVAPGGDDGAAGTPGAPFATVAHALAVAGSGDTMYLARGGVWRESGLSLNNGETLTAEGAGADPVICGSVALDGWTAWPTNANIFTASVPGGGTVGSVYLDGVFLGEARYPNSGWLRVDTGSGANLIVDAALNGSGGQWTGATVRWRKWSWWYESRPITADDGAGHLTLGGASAIAGLTGIGSGYYLADSLAALDAPGEWYHDEATDTVFLWPPVGVDLATATVEAAVSGSGMTIKGGSLIGIHLRHYTTKAVSLADRAGTITGCCFTQLDADGVSSSWNSAGSQVVGNVFADIRNVAFTVNENPAGGTGTLFASNTLQRIGSVPGLGGSGTWHAAGIIISNAAGVTVRRNRITDTGYAGIILGTDGMVVEENVFRRCMATLNDGAAIYTNCNASSITGNIILDTIGDLDSSHPWTPLGHGIWLEFLSRFHDSQVIDNTVAGSGADGLFLPNNFDCAIDGNTLFGNRRSGLTLTGHDDTLQLGDLNQHNDLTDNILAIGANPWQAQPDEPENLETWADTQTRCLGYEIYGDRDFDYGTMSGTAFVVPSSGAVRCYRSDRNARTIAEWQAQEPSWADPSPAELVGPAHLFINDTATDCTMTVPTAITWQTLGGTPVTGGVLVPAFRSVVLVATAGDTGGLPPYSLLSERRRIAIAVTGSTATVVIDPSATTTDAGPGHATFTGLSGGDDHVITFLAPVDG